jgi:glycosyltransferase involved in cell wall biosynthesis
MYKLSLVLIVKNESRCIERCLSSFREFVDEIILVDSGSTDDTIQKAKKYQPIIQEIEWRNDFSWARNTALEMSSGDWNMVVDADEWLIGGGQTLLDLKTKSAEFVGVIKIENQLGDDSQMQRSHVTLPRVLPRVVRYVGKIHEQPKHTFPTQRLDIRFGHDGYLGGQQVQKRGRNEQILRAELANTPEDAYFNYQLGKDLAIQEKFQESIVFLENAKSRSSSQMIWRHDLIVRLLFSYKKEKKFSEGFDLIANEEQHFIHSPDFYFCCGDFCIDAALYLPDHSQTLIPMIESYFLKARVVGENSQIDDRVVGRGSFLAAYNLYAFYSSTGRNELANEYLKLYEAEKI